jgi:hypothetical protein
LFQGWRFSRSPALAGQSEAKFLKNFCCSRYVLAGANPGLSTIKQACCGSASKAFFDQLITLSLTG